MTLRCFSEVFYHLYDKSNSYNDNRPIRRRLGIDGWLKKLMAHFNKISFIYVVVWLSAWHEFKGGWKEAEVLRMNLDSSRKTHTSKLKCCIWQKVGIQGGFVLFLTREKAYQCSFWVLDHHMEVKHYVKDMIIIMVK